MAMDHANSFVERIFENDEFVRGIIKKRGYNRNERTSEEYENEKIVEIANSMGFKFGVEEYKTACKEYMSGLDGWEAVQKIFHVLKIAAEVADGSRNKY